MMTENTETLDYLNDNRQVIGKATRHEVHQKGLWHQTFHCWIIGFENEHPYLLFQRRSLEKHNHPGLYDISAAGHLLTGESPQDGLRELKEELGISVQWEELIPLGVKVDVSEVKGEINREFCHTYLLENRFTKIDFKLQKEEVMGLMQLFLPDAYDLFSAAKSEVDAKVYESDTEGKLYAPHRGKIDLSMILPHPDYLKTCIMVERYFEGKSFLAI
jgi:isopentenyldiphosphate isomerase